MQVSTNFKIIGTKWWLMITNDEKNEKEKANKTNISNMADGGFLYEIITGRYSVKGIVL